MITNPLFRECLANVSDETRAEFNLSFEIADRIDALLAGISLALGEPIISVPA